MGAMELAEVEIARTEQCQNMLADHEIHVAVRGHELL